MLMSIRKPEHISLDEMPELAGALHDRLSRLSRQLRSIELPQGMTQERMSVLAIILRSGPISVSALAQHERVRPATMSRMISGLEIDGYVERLSDATDGRGVLVIATSSGHEAFAKARERRLTQLAMALGELPEEHFSALSDLTAALEYLTSILDRSGN
jgi:DNA-binding MarR family transcriptional regulator